jgi:hypothetical protein
MRATVCFLLAFGLATAAVLVRANVPPPNWRPTTFGGPGLLCGAGFTFALETGETATEGFPSQGTDPVYIRSHGGLFAIVSHVADAMQVDKASISSSPSGSVYAVTNVIRESSSGVPRQKMYWFQPATGAPFSVDFYAAVPGQGGWAAFPSSEYDDVLKRVSFAGPGQQNGCLSPTGTN